MLQLKSNARLRFFCCRSYFPCYTGLSIPTQCSTGGGSRRLCWPWLADISTDTHIYSVRVDIFSPGVLLHTVGYKHPCATYIKYDHWVISVVEVTVLLKLSSGCSTPLLHLLPRSPLFSAVLCSIEIAPVQSCALHVLVLLRGLKPFFFVSRLCIEKFLFMNRLQMQPGSQLHTTHWLLYGL